MQTQPTSVIFTTQPLCPLCHLPLGRPGDQHMKLEFAASGETSIVGRFVCHVSMTVQQPGLSCVLTDVQGD